MEHELIQSFMKVSCGLCLLLCFIPGVNAWAVLAGTLWGISNLYLIKYSLKNLLITKSLFFCLVFFIKFPVLYSIGYCLLLLLPATGLLVGFSLVIASIFFVSLKRQTA